MRTHTFFKVAVLSGLLALAGCASKVAAPEQYSGFLKDYSGLQQTTSATGKPTLRWVDPSYNEANYDSILWTPITYYPAPKPTTQIGQNAFFPAKLLMRSASGSRSSWPIPIPK